MTRVVAIDGAAGSGKSTLACGLARALGLAYVNTGFMYRALTRRALDRAVDVEDGRALATLMETLTFTLEGSGPPELWIDGARPGDDLHAREVETSVSAVARHSSVRARMRDAQRILGAGGAVMEGRDIGTVVFPDAPVKLFLMADPAARARRRADERARESGPIERELHERDRLDDRTNRVLGAPANVEVIDTGTLDAEAALREALRIVRSKAPELVP
jgi:CMP/dCMP kinase